MLCAFYCSEYDENKGLDEYIQHHLIGNPDCVSYCLIDPDAERIIGLFALSCSGIMVEWTDENNRSHIKIDPAVEIKIFALDRDYQHTELEEYSDNRRTIGDFLFGVCVDYIHRQVCETFGANKIVLYANSPDSASFYTRNSFKAFETDMRPDEQFFTDGCIPMYLPISPMI